MVFLVLLITLCGYSLLGYRVDERYDNWFFAFHGWLEARLQKWPLVSMLAVLLLPLLAIHWLLATFENGLFGLLGVVLYAAILFYSLGRGNLVEQTQSYLERWRDGDIQSAYHYAIDYFRLPEGSDIEDINQMHESVRAGLFYQWFEQIFVILFWFILAGPLGALFIRLLCLYEKALNDKDSADDLMPLQLQHVVQWLPARLLGFTFAIAGNFTLCFKVWMEAIMDWRRPTQDVLHNSGMAALGVCKIDENDRRIVIFDPALFESYAGELETIQELVIRSLVVWVVVLALLTIF